MSDRVRVRRNSKRGRYDRETIDAILDEALVCHLGFAVDSQPYVIPTICARDGDVLYVHGSAASRALRALGGGAPACVTVTLVDGLVLARSVFHHSMNYRSVVVLGQARLVNEADAKLGALRVITEHVCPGRWDEARLPTERELAATSVLAMPLDEASAKVRTGPPVDDEPDYDLPVWAGVVPMGTAVGDPVPDAGLADGLSPPAVGRARWRGSAAGN